MDFDAYNKALLTLKADIRKRIAAFEQETDTRIVNINSSSYYSEIGSLYPYIADIEISAATRSDLLVKK